jgi:hypothetical protein
LIEETAMEGFHDRCPFERDESVEELRSSEILIGMGE